MPNSTTNFSYNKPLVNNATDADLWGGYLNTNWDSLDADLPITTSSKTADFSVGTDEFNYMYLIDSSSGAVTATLPAASGVFNGFTVSFKASDVTNTITLDGNGSETIEGKTTVTMPRKNSVITLVCDGTNWVIKGRKGNLINVQIFSSSGTYTPTSGALTANVIVRGASGGGGGGGGGTSGSAGGDGGATSFVGFSQTLTSNPGTGGDGGASGSVSNGAHGTATGGDSNVTGGGQPGGARGNPSSDNEAGGTGGNGGLCIKSDIDVSSGTATITIGAAGSAGAPGTSASAGLAGIQGIIEIYEFD